MGVPKPGLTRLSRQYPAAGFRHLHHGSDVAAGCADITTRANVQLRGVTLAEADKVFDGLQAVGLSSVSTGDHLMALPSPWPSLPPNSTEHGIHNGKQTEVGNT